MFIYGVRMHVMCSPHVVCIRFFKCVHMVFLCSFVVSPTICKLCLIYCFPYDLFMVVICVFMVVLRSSCVSHIISMFKTCVSMVCAFLAFLL